MNLGRLADLAQPRSFFIFLGFILCMSLILIRIVLRFLVVPVARSLFPNTS